MATKSILLNFVNIRTYIEHTIGDQKRQVKLWLHVILISPSNFNSKSITQKIIIFQFWQAEEELTPLLIDTLFEFPAIGIDAATLEGTVVAVVVVVVALLFPDDVDIFVKLCELCDALILGT